MKKILLIENVPEHFESFHRVFQGDNMVILSNQISLIYDIKSKNFKDLNEFTIIFIHNSFSQDGVNSEIVADLENQILLEKTTKLIKYSGGTTTAENITNPNQLVMLLTRKTINKNIKNFVDFSKTVEQWYLPALFFENYKTRFLKKSLSELSEKYDEQLAKKCLLVLGYPDINPAEYEIENILTLINKKLND